MIYISHRVNLIDQLRTVPVEHGVEIDLRDRGDRLILQHDPFSDGENFDDWLAGYNHRLLILNIKSERIEHRVLESLKRRKIESYFFLDCSFPMMRQLILAGESRIAVRFSEFEPLENCLALAGQVKWVWVDCFTKMPLTPTIHEQLRRHFRLCAVSPELQGRSVDEIARYATEISPYHFDAVCTKRPHLWEVAMNQLKSA